MPPPALRTKSDFPSQCQCYANYKIGYENKDINQHGRSVDLDESTASYICQHIILELKGELIIQIPVLGND